MSISLDFDYLLTSADSKSSRALVDKLILKFLKTLLTGGENEIRQQKLNPR